MVLLCGMKRAALVQLWSVMVSMESKPFESGNLTMKSIATVSNGSASGCGKMGVSGAFLACVLTLFH
jgi:hypothetical protein